MFCTLCGKKLIKKTIKAEKYFEFSEVGKIYPYAPYDEKTGARQFSLLAVCPNTKKIFTGWLHSIKLIKILKQL